MDELLFRTLLGASMPASPVELRPDCCEAKLQRRGVVAAFEPLLAGWRSAAPRSAIGRKAPSGEESLHCGSPAEARFGRSSVNPSSGVLRPDLRREHEEETLAPKTERIRSKLEWRSTGRPDGGSTGAARVG